MQKMLGPRNFCHCIHIEEMQGQSQQHNYKLPKTATLAMRREEFFKLKVEGDADNQFAFDAIHQERRWGKSQFSSSFFLHSMFLRFFPGNARGKRAYQADRQVRGLRHLPSHRLHSYKVRYYCSDEKRSWTRILCRSNLRKKLSTTV